MTTRTMRSKWLGIGGIVASLGFVVAALVQSLLRDDHSLLADPISALAAGPDGWIQNVSFLAAGALLLLFAGGVHLALRPSRAGVLGPAFVALFGFGLLGAGVFPAATADGVFVEDQVPVAHVVAGMVTFVSAGLAALFLSGRLARDPRWRDLAGYVRISGVILVALFLLGGALVRPSAAPFHDWLGLFQWVFIAVWYACVLVLAGRLLRAQVAEDAASRR